jgi:hypothetical protein
MSPLDLVSINWKNIKQYTCMGEMVARSTKSFSLKYIALFLYIHHNYTWKIDELVS